MVIQSSGNMFIGGGESPNSLYSLLKNSSSENMYVAADSYVYIESNGNTIANRLGFYLDTAQQIIPCKAETATNNVGSIGTSSYKWANMYATTFHGALDGNAATATTATTATKAGQDGDGNTISSTYVKKSSVTTGSVTSIAGVGTLPTLTTSVSGSTLTITFSQGTLPTKANAITVVTSAG